MTGVLDLVIGLGWIAFLAYWIMMAAKAGKPMQPREPKGVLIRVLIIALVLIILRIAPKGWLQAHNNPYLQLIGLALFILGLLIAIWARVSMGDSWGFPADKQKGTKLITTGPYKFIRHPIYAGVLLAMLGTGIGLTSTWIIIFLAFGFYFVWSAIYEEKYLIKQFPTTYPNYVKKTKMLIPFLF
ncbi:MAG: methyltransferase family protein [Candidatus Saccharimonadales bacterium]